MKKPIQYKTKRLTITALDDETLTRPYDAETDAHMKAAYDEMLAGCAANKEQRLFWTEWRIALRDGTPVGGLCFKGAPVNGEIEIGYAIDEPHRQKGYAAEAVKAMLDWAFSQENVYLISAETEPGNNASRALLTKLGFKPVGMGREGPRYELARPDTAWMPIFLCLGMSTGMSLGVALGHIPIGMLIGMALGMLLGVCLDRADKEKRAAFEKAREKAKTDADGE